MGWLARLFSSRRSPSPAVPLARSSAPAAPAPAPEPSAAAVDEPAPLLPWLLDCGAPEDAALSPAERQALDVLDKMLAQPALPDDLLPRAAALIPQLLAMLRQTALPVQALAQRVSKDVVLAAEVLRLASSPYYRARGPVGDLAQAIALIGEAGLQTVIARVVLKPMYDSLPGTLSARAAHRLWDHAEALARQMTALAAAAGQPAFDAYLAGLLYDSGWNVALRLLDRAAVGLRLPPSKPFANACAERAHRLFGQAAQRWTITPAFTAFGADARAHSLAASPHPLGALLRQAMPLAMAGLNAGASK